jgi:hypothetical protein
MFELLFFILLGYTISLHISPKTYTKLNEIYLTIALRLIKEDSKIGEMIRK